MQENTPILRPSHPMECIAIMTTRKIPSYFSRDINDNTQNPASDSNRNNATKRFIFQWIHQMNLSQLRELK
jgi:hypothetical protein